MTLYAHEVEPAQKARKIRLFKHTALTDEMKIPRSPIGHPLGRPGDVAVAQQGDEVVGDGPHHRVLKIEDAGIARLGQHQVARVIVSMDAHPRLLQGTRHEPILHGRERGGFFRRKHKTRQRPQKPLAEQTKLSAQKGLVVARQTIRRATRLDHRQSAQCIVVEPIGRLLGQLAEIHPVAEIGEHEEAGGAILRVDLGRVETHRAKASRQIGETSAVLEIGGRIHQHARRPVVKEPPIATKTRVGGGGLQLEVLRLQDPRRPAAHRLVSIRHGHPDQSHRRRGPTGPRQVQDC